jgi:hypothetical protein
VLPDGSISKTSSERRPLPTTTEVTSASHSCLPIVGAHGPRAQNCRGAPRMEHPAANIPGFLSDRSLAWGLFLWNHDRRRHQIQKARDALSDSTPANFLDTNTHAARTRTHKASGVNPGPRDEMTWLAVEGVSGAVPPELRKRFKAALATPDDVVARVVRATHASAGARRTRTRVRQSHSARRQRIGFARTAEPGTATRYWWPSAPVVTM